MVGARVVPVELALGPPADPLLLRVIGNGFADRQTLRDAANELKRIVNEQPETWNVHDSWGVDGFQVLGNTDQDALLLHVPQLVHDHAVVLVVHVQETRLGADQ